MGSDRHAFQSDNRSYKSATSLGEGLAGFIHPSSFLYFLHLVDPFSEKLANRADLTPGRPPDNLLDRNRLQLKVS